MEPTEIAEAVKALAEQLSTTASTLVEYFAVRAPYELVGPAISLLCLLIFVGIGYRAFRYLQGLFDSDDNTDREAQPKDIAAVGFIVLGVAGSLVSTITLVAHTPDAIKALISPEAYAVEEILRAIK